MAGLPASRKRLIALVLALALIISLVVVAATSGLGRPGVPSGDVAIVDGVDNGTVSNEEYQRALEQSAARLGLEKPPKVGSQEFQQVNDDAMQGLLLAIWARGEAADRGIEVTDSDVQDELTQVKNSFQNEKEFARVVRQSKFCTEEEIKNDTPPIECADVVKQGRLLALQRKLSEAFSSKPTISDSEIEDFYNANIDAFRTPATRTARVILNEDKAKVEQAKSQLEGLSPDDKGFAAAWKSAAKKYSQDQASKDRGGLLEGLVQGQGDPQLDEQVFAAPQGELVGPFQTDRGWYLIEVVDVTEETTQSLDEASDAIRQQLVAARQQAHQTDVQNDFLVKWTRRTICVPEVRMQFCSGYVAPEPQAVPGQPQPPQPPPVQSSRPIEPGTASLSVDGSTQTGLPQGPRPPASGQAAGAGGAQGLPPGAVPVGPGGAPATGGAGGATGGAATPGTTP